MGTQRHGALGIGFGFGLEPRLRLGAGLALGLVLVLTAIGPASADAELAEVPRASAETDDAAPVGAGDPQVARAVITNAIEDREPVDSVSQFRNDQPIIFFFTELVDLQGTDVTHRWEFEGEPMADVPFAVASPRWRVWSSKNLEPEWTGDWTVKVLASDGEVLEEVTFQYTAVDAAPPAAPAARSVDAGATPVDTPSAVDTPDPVDTPSAAQP